MISVTGVAEHAQSNATFTKDMGQDQDVRRFIQLDKEYREAIFATVPTEMANAPTQAIIDIADLTNSTVHLRVPAGRLAKVTISGLQGLHITDMTLTLQVVGNYMALPLPLNPLPGSSDSFWATDIPIFVTSLISRASFSKSGSGEMVATVDGQDETLPLCKHLPLCEHLPLSRQKNPICGKLSKIIVREDAPSQTSTRITALVPNVCSGLRLSGVEDQTLHQYPRQLQNAESLTTPDLSDYLNEQSANDSATLQLSSLTDCVLVISAEASFHHDDEEETPSPHSVALYPWHTLYLDAAVSETDAKTRVLLDAKETGAQPLGFHTSQGTLVGVHIGPRQNLLQPLHLSAPLPDGKEMAGVWLFFNTPPQRQASLDLTLTTFDADQMQNEETLAHAWVNFDPLKDKMQKADDKTWYLWIPFDHPVPAQNLELFDALAIILSDVSQGLDLLERPLTNDQLSPALSRDFMNSDLWRQRRFGSNAKALIFDLGVI